MTTTPQAGPTGSGEILECVVNVSEGRDPDFLGLFARACGTCLLDLHHDGAHHRSVFTLAGADGPVQAAVKELARCVVTSLDLRRHAGAHPRLGTLDVVPWVALGGWPLGNVVPGPGREGATGDRPLRDAAAGDRPAGDRPAGDRPAGDRPAGDRPAGDRAKDARDRFASWAADELELPVFLYGPERSLPQLRRDAWERLRPDLGPAMPHPAAGAVAVGCRPLMVAYNLWLAGPDLAKARAVAAAIRSPAVRALGFALQGGVQVSCNLIDPLAVGPAAVWDQVVALAPIARAELVGLVPLAVLQMVPEDRWGQLDMASERTIEARLRAAAEK